MKLQNEFIELITSYLNGELTPNEYDILLEWVNNSPENKALFDAYSKIWLTTTLNKKTDTFNSSKALVAINLQKKSVTKSVTLNANTILKIAAIFIFVAFISGLVSYLIWGNVKNNNSVCILEAPIGSRAKATLPDGTQVWLNACSKLIYHTNFNTKTREVQLTGEGYFKVTHNPDKPFIVSANKLFVKAVGTSFNVKAYPGEGQITTTLVEGNIVLSGKDSDQKSFNYQMKPKQKVTYWTKTYPKINHKSYVQTSKAANTNSISLKENSTVKETIEPTTPIESNNNVKTELYTSWKDDSWIIESENLGDLAVLLERRYNVRIRFENNELKQYRFSANIQNETIEQIFEIIRLTMPISYIANKGEITLKADKKLKKIYNLAYKQK